MNSMNDKHGRKPNTLGSLQSSLTVFSKLEYTFLEECPLWGSEYFLKDSQERSLQESSMSITKN